MKICELEDCDNEVTPYKYGDDRLKRFCSKTCQNKSCSRRYRESLGQPKSAHRAEVLRLRKIIKEHGISL